MFGSVLEVYVFRSGFRGVGGFKIVRDLKIEDILVCLINVYSLLFVIVYKIL